MQIERFRDRLSPGFAQLVNSPLANPLADLQHAAIHLRRPRLPRPGIHRRGRSAPTERRDRPAPRRPGYFPTNVFEEGAGRRRRHKKAQRAAKVSWPPPLPRRRRKGSFSSRRKTVKAKSADDFHPPARDADRRRPAAAARPHRARRNRNATSVLKNTINTLADSVQGGSTFSESLGAAPEDLQQALRQHGEGRRTRRRARARAQPSRRVPGKGAEDQEQGRVRDGLSGHRACHRRGHHDLPADLHRAEVRSRSSTTCWATSRCRRITQFVIGVSNFVQRSLAASCSARSSPSIVGLQARCPHTRAAARSSTGSKLHAAALRRPAAQERDLPLRAHARHAGHQRRADPAGAQHHPRNRRQRRHRRRHHEGARRRQGRRIDRAAARSQRRLPADGHQHGRRRRGNRPASRRCC